MIFFSHVFVSAHSPPRSPDSVLKLKLCPTLPFFPASSSSQAYRSTFGKGSRGEYHDQRRQLLSNASPPPHYTLFETHLGSQSPSPVALESISRSPDERFLVQLLEESSSSSKKKSLMEGIQQVNGGASGSPSNRTSFRESPKSSIISSEKDEKRTSPLTVDVPELNIPPSSPGRVRAMASNFSRHGCFYSDDELSSEALLERASFYSDISEKKPSDSFRRGCVPGRAEDMFPSIYRKTKLLDRNRPCPSDSQLLDSEFTDNRTVISKLCSDLGRDRRDKCIQLAKERHENKGELGNYTAEQSCGQSELQSNQVETPQREILKSKEEPVWKPQHVTMRPKHMPVGQTSSASEYRWACYFGNTSSPTYRSPRSCIQWDISPITMVTSHVPVQTHQETTTFRSRHSQTCMETTEDSLTIEASHFPVTQNTSLPVVTPEVPLEDPTPVLDVQTLPRASLSLQAVAEPVLRDNALDEGIEPISRHSYSGSLLWDSASRSPAVDSERPGSSATASKNLNCRTAAIEYTATKYPSPTRFSTLPCHQHEVEARGVESERESVRTCSKRTDKSLFTDSPSPISTLSLVEEVDTELSQFSVPRMSGTFKAKPTGPSAKMSPQQTSAVLEYLSLPGFIEMSVDEPEEDAEITGTSGKSAEQMSEKSLRTKTGVVPKNWQVRSQEYQEINSKQGTVFGQATFAPDAASRSHYNSKQVNKCSIQRKSRDSAVRVRFHEIRTSSPSVEKTQIPAGSKNTDRPEFTLGSGSANTLLTAAKGMAEVVAKHSQRFLDGRESLLEQSQGQCSQGSRVNNIASRICQVPVPFLKKSFSAGPCRALSGTAHPHPFLKKSFSLCSQRWEHFEMPRSYISEKCYWDEFSSPDIRSYSLGRSQSSSPRPDPVWREYISHRRPSVGSLESPGTAQRSLASSSYLTSSPYTPRQNSVTPFLEPADPRRQAAVFPESSRCSPYQDMFRSAQHNYGPMPSSSPLPQHPHWPGPRGEPRRSIDPRRCPSMSYLPKSVIRPSNYYAPATPREGDVYPHPDRMIRREGEMEGGRTSYASQSSGRGSAILFRQSLCVTPTLLSSPETTEESEGLRAEGEPERRSKR